MQKIDFRSRIITLTFIIIGIIGIASSIAVTPDFAAKYISEDGIITPEYLRKLQTVRWISLFNGCLLLSIGLLFLKFHEHIQAFIRRPIGTSFILLFVFGILAFIHYILIQIGVVPFFHKFFPFVSAWPGLHISGLPYSILFLLTFYLELKYIHRFNIIQVWIAGLILILLGNLAQGSVENAFYIPFYAIGDEYYFNAIQITDWRDWVRNFNANQLSLTSIHAMVHPPFAVLLHYFFLKLGFPILAGSFILLSSLSIILVWQIMKSLGLTSQQSSQLALLFSVIPAINIYSAVSFDGIIAMLSTMFIFGIVKITRDREFQIGAFLFICSILLTNLLTFGGIFWLAVAGLIGIREIIINKRYSILIALCATSVVALIIYALMFYFLGYDHVQAFFTAAAREQQGTPPPTFYGEILKTKYSYNYFWTRIENIAEIAAFLSIGILVLLFHSNYLKLRIFDLHDDITSIFLAGIISLFLFMLSGAYSTGGETARACLYIYPYFILILRKVEEPVLRKLIVVAGFQTILMQTFGGYIW